MFGISKCLKTLNMPQTLIGKTNEPETKKRFTQVIQPEYNRVIKKPRNKY